MDLFNNPMVNNALKSMTPEQLAEYKNMGNYLFNSVDFVDSKILNHNPIPVEESIAYIEQGIKSGLLPQDLTEDEVEHLETVYGKQWYLRYGFKVEDVPETGLSLQMKKDIDKAIKLKVDELNKNN